MPGDPGLCLTQNPFPRAEFGLSCLSFMLPSKIPQSDIRLNLNSHLQLTAPDLPDRQSVDPFEMHCRNLGRTWEAPYTGAYGCSQPEQDTGRFEPLVRLSESTDSS